MSSFDDENEKTSIVPSDTFKGKIRAADSSPPSLMLLIGPPSYMGKAWSLVETEATVGRSIDCQIYVDDKSLSRHHAKFVVYGSDVSVMDLGSTNKTVVNGTVIGPLTPVKLKHNDQIKAGNIIFKFLESGSLEAVSQQDVYERSQKDALTGAHTKGALLVRGPEAIKRSETVDEPLSIIVFDIDHFKKINDTYGHSGGDYVLKELGNVVGTKLVRSHDYFARYGGEEFVIILMGGSAKQAVDVAERIRTTVEGHDFVFEGAKIPVTVSLGVAMRNSSEVIWDDLFKRADAALYESKKTGRNRATLAK